MHDPLDFCGLACPACFVLGMAAFFAICVQAVRQQKRHVRPLKPLSDGLPEPSDPGTHPYLDAVNELAGQMGFTFEGTFVYAAIASGQLRASVWRSPALDVLVFVVLSRAGLFFRKVTILVSQVGGRYFVTADHLGEDDISGLTSVNIILHAHLPELVERHERRLESLGEEPEPFLAAAVLMDIETIHRRQADQLVSRGYATFLDDGRSVYRHTTRGAIRYCVRWLFEESIQQALTPFRQWRRRPGSV